MPPNKKILPALSRSDRRDADQMIEDLDDDLDAARRQGVFGLLRLRFEAWRDDKLGTAFAAKLEARKAMVEKRRLAEEAEQQLRRTVHGGYKEETLQDIQSRQLERIRELSEQDLIPGVANQLLPALGLPTQPPPSPLALTDGGGVTAQIDSHQVAALALQIWMQVAAGGLSEADLPACWAELSARYSPLVAREVEQSFHAIRAGSLDAPGVPPRPGGGGGGSGMGQW